jgi:pimeloyl-ACP methyl ester carboxylesterase
VLHIGAVLDNGYILVQPGYRLLIPTNGHDIIQDVRNFYDYLASPAYTQTLPENVRPDLGKIVVAGFSGGGYVSRLAAIELIESVKKGRRKGIECTGMVSYFGMGGDVFQPDWAENKNEKSDPMDEVEHLYKRKEISDSPYTPGLKGWENRVDRDMIWDWFRSNGVFVDVLAGTRGTALRDAWAKTNSGSGSVSRMDIVRQIVPEEHHPVIPQIWFETPSNASSFPPSIYVHGTADDKVPYAESVLTVEQLRKAGKGSEEVEFVTIDGVDHDLKVPGESECRPEVDEAHGKVAEFILRQLRA